MDQELARSLLPLSPSHRSRRLLSASSSARLATVNHLLTGKPQRGECESPGQQDATAALRHKLPRSADILSASSPGFPLRVEEKIRPQPWPEVRDSPPALPCNLLLHMQQKVVIAATARARAKLGSTLEETRPEALTRDKPDDRFGFVLNGITLFALGIVGANRGEIDVLVARQMAAPAS